MTERLFSPADAARGRRILAKLNSGLAAVPAFAAGGMIGGPVGMKLAPPDRPTPELCNVCGCNPNIKPRARVESYHNRKGRLLWRWTCPAHPRCELTHKGYATVGDAHYFARHHLAYDHGVWS